MSNETKLGISGDNDAGRGSGARPTPDAMPSAIPPRGDYRTLLTFQKGELVYDITFRFAHKFLAKGDRTIDQMIQAAR